MSQAKRLVDEANRILDNAESVGRRLDGAERAEVEDLLDRAREHSDYEKRSRDIHTKLDGGYSGDPSVTWGHNDPGAKFVSSDGYRKIKSAASRGQTWSSGPVDVGLLAKGTLMENVGGAGPGGGLVPPQYAPGVVSTLFQPLGLADYFPQQTLTGSQLRYIVEGTATSTAAGVPEGGVKPEATLGYTEVVEPVKKLAQVVPVSDELLEDAVQIQQYVGGRLTMFVKVEEERQLLRGAGGNDLTGIFGRSISTTNAGTTNVDRIFRAAAGVRGSAFLDPNLVVMHPTNWVTARLQQDTTGQYLGGGPWGGSYGNTAGAATSSFTSSPLWNMQVFVSTVVGAGTALVGSTQGAALWRKGGVTVEASNSHNDFFIRDLHMLRAEERLALACYRPSAFCAVTGLT